MEICRQGIRNDSRNYWAYLGLGCAYGRQGDANKELEAYTEAIRISPDFVPAHHALGLSCARMGRHQEAIDAFKQCIRINPDFAEAHLNLIITYNAIDDKKAALQQLQDFRDL
jgi:tetratricopeptide (TPR) repeat protein